MKFFKCQNCGSELTKNADNTYSCGYCKRTYYDDSLEKAYERVYQNLRGTVQGIVTEELLKQKLEQIANCRQALYKARNGVFIKSSEVLKWSEEILKLSPDDAQANFYAIAAKKRWSELNKFMSQLNAREASYLVEGFVDYLTKDGQFAQECVLNLMDLIDRSFGVTSPAYAECHKKIVKADEIAKSGIFDVELSRDVFVAYSSKDKEKAYELVEYLENNGFDCFIAMRNLAKGVDAELEYNERLKKAIDSCQVFLLVSSKNSRTRNCDAYRIEMQYVKDSDIRNASNVAVAKAQYDLYLEKNRNRCKPRLEYLIDEYGASPYEKIVKQFFGGLTWYTSLDGVLNGVFNLIEGAELDETAEEKLARERAEFERQKAEFENLKKAESERLKKQVEEARLKKEAGEAERKRKEEQEFEIENGVLKKYNGKGGEVVIPDSVTAIGQEAFCDCDSLTSITIPNSVTSIGDGAFCYCTSLTSVVIGDSVTRIGESAFIECYGLTSVVIGNSVTSIGSSAFAYCDSLTSVVIPNSVTSIGYEAFYGCSNLTSVVIGDSVTSIGDYAFYGCSNLEYNEYDNSYYLGNQNNKYLVLVKAKDTSITTCTIHKDTKVICYNAFYNCDSLTSVVIPNSVTSIGSGAFYDCDSLTSVVIPDSVTSIGEDAFYDCPIENVTMPTNAISSIPKSNLKTVVITSGDSIGSYAFYNCSSLTSVVIPDSVTSIGGYAFNGCSNLTIYAETKHKPKDWYSVLLGKNKGSWNPDKRPVVWGATIEDFNKA